MKAHKTVCIIQARLGSTRLPGKVLMDIAGKPMLRHVIERAQDIKGVDQVVVAVPFEEMHEFSRLFPDVQVIGGHPTDVLARYYEAAVLAQADVVVRITSDCPLLSPAESSRILRVFMETHMDIADNVCTHADGWDTEVFTADLLWTAHTKATEAYDREHVTPWMRRHAAKRLHWPPPNLLADKLSVDTVEDLKRVREALA